MAASGLGNAARAPSDTAGGSDNLAFVKTARLWLLIVLAVLLPLRGALAQALPCAGGHGGHPVHAMQGHAHGPHQAPPTGQALPHELAEGHAHHAAGSTACPGAGHGPGHAAGDPAQCSACATCCIGAPIASTVASLLPVLPPATLTFSFGSAPVPRGVPDRLDRPPRSA